MKKYTFESWLNDEIDYRLPGGQNILETQNGLFTLCYGEGLISKEDYNKIRKAQEEAYDTTVNLSVESYIKYFKEIYDESSYKCEYLDNKISRIEKLIDENPIQKDNVLAEFKDFKYIKGSEYQKIMNEKGIFDFDNGKFKSFASGWILNNNIRITTFYKCLQWLIEFRGKQKNHIRPDMFQENIPLKLNIVFESTSKYKQIMELLVEKEHCQPHIYIWKDEKKGNKGFLVAILKYLHKQGYYKKNRRLTNEEIRQIAKNTFGCTIGIDTVKHTKPDNPGLKFIPLASTLQ